MSGALSLDRFPIHLGLGATAIVEPEFSGWEWYEAYAQRHLEDGVEGRLVSQFTFMASWDSWEMHLHGDEVVVCLSGAMDLIQESAGGAQVRTLLGPGDYAINPRGVWHTADIECAATALFITAGLGTEHRPR